MSRSLLRIAGLALAAFATFALPMRSDAQLGGLIKKKVKEAIKPPEKATPAPQPTAGGAPAPAKTVENSPASRDPFAGMHVPGERAILITDEMTARMMRGLDSEQVMVKALEKEIARYPTPEQFEACKVRWAMSPEGKRAMDMSRFVKEGMKPDELQKGMMKMSTESDSLVKKACPLDPQTWSDYNRSEKRREIRKKAAAQSDSDPVRVMDENNFGEMIERVLKYCELKKSMDVKPKSGGIKTPGVGKDIYWIYTEAELKALQKLDCDAFKKKYANLLGAYT